MKNILCLDYSVCADRYFISFWNDTLRARTSRIRYTRLRLRDRVSNFGWFANSSRRWQIQQDLKLFLWTAFPAVYHTVIAQRVLECVKHIYNCSIDDCEILLSSQQATTQNQWPSRHASRMANLSFFRISFNEKVLIWPPYVWKERCKAFLTERKFSNVQYVSTVCLSCHITTNIRR